MRLDQEVFDALDAGHALDAAIAIHVLGRTDRIEGHLPPRGAGREPGGPTYITDGCFSTNDEEALRILKHYAAQGVPYVTDLDPVGEIIDGKACPNYSTAIGVFADIIEISYPAGKVWWGMASTFAESVARAALAYEVNRPRAAVKVEPEAPPPEPEPCGHPRQATSNGRTVCRDCRAFL